MTDHRPLLEAYNAYTRQEKGALIVGIYCFEPSIENQPDYSAFHNQHIRESVAALRNDLLSINIPLLVGQSEVVELITAIRQQHQGAFSLFCHEETGNRASFQRDRALIQRCKTTGINLSEHPNNGTVRRLKNRDERSSVRNKRMHHHQYSLPKKWKQHTDYHARLHTFPALLKPVDTHRQYTPIQHGGTENARTLMASFLSERSTQYLYTIGKPHESTSFSSRISPYLTYGSVSMKQIEHATQAKLTTLNAQKKSANPASQEHRAIQSHIRHLRGFKSRLHRHDHFIQKLESDPTIELRNSHPFYDRIRRPEDTNEEYMRRFEQGTTGIPLIDAAIRCVKTTGRLNFRLRATLTSFICNTCMQDRKRPAHLMAQRFTDYEPGIHYSQFQMQSGTTGINQYRIYNPVKQAIEKDPDGTFIDLRCPELRDVPMPLKAQPRLLERGLFTGTIDYPPPMIDIEQANRAAREILRSIKKLPGFASHAARIYQKLGSRRKQSRLKRTTTHV